MAHQKETSTPLRPPLLGPKQPTPLPHPEHAWPCKALLGGASDPGQGPVPPVQQARCSHWSRAFGMWVGTSTAVSPGNPPQIQRLSPAPPPPGSHPSGHLDVHQGREHCLRGLIWSRTTRGQSQSRHIPAPRQEVKDWSGTSARWRGRSFHRHPAEHGLRTLSMGKDRKEDRN